MMWLVLLGLFLTTPPEDPPAPPPETSLEFRTARQFESVERAMYQLEDWEPDVLSQESEDANDRP